MSTCGSSLHGVTYSNRNDSTDTFQCLIAGLRVSTRLRVSEDVDVPSHVAQRCENHLLMGLRLGRPDLAKDVAVTTRP